MPHRTIRNEADLADLGRLFGGFDFPFTVEWVKGRNRSLDQNALLWKWATEAAQQLGDVLPIEVQRRWKLEIGVPILREDSEEFRAFYDKALKGLSYEMKTQAMEWVPVTRLFKVSQMTRFLDTVQRECAQNGIQLTEPEE